MGAIKQPFTTAWWCLFVLSVWITGADSRRHESPAVEHLKGITCICAATMSMGFYGAQVLAPSAFRSMVMNWAVHPLVHAAPAAKPLLRWAQRDAFWVSARLADCFLHFIPSVIAMYLFCASVTVTTAVMALPLNMVWLACTGARSLEATNQLYGITPPLSKLALNYVYASHWALCTGVAVYCLARD